jgi:hypothetical protein
MYDLQIKRVDRFLPFLTRLVLSLLISYFSTEKLASWEALVVTFAVSLILLPMPRNLYKYIMKQYLVDGEVFDPYLSIEELIAMHLDAQK